MGGCAALLKVGFAVEDGLAGVYQAPALLLSADACSSRQVE
jgi:hypothetical protein